MLLVDKGFRNDNEQNKENQDDTCRSPETPNSTYSAHSNNLLSFDTP